ncbi:MAG: hypothetical protein E2O57_06480 [Gammaproteobacteria bacterium]|nr:MAG: hypothetical protein E2O57_06480 [Gammaproteobacteria bacterium]
MFKKIILALFLIYLLGFFLWAPVNMAGISLEWYQMSQWSRKYDEVAHKSWIIPLGSENIFYRLRYNNLMFWCEQFEHCQKNIGQ